MSQPNNTSEFPLSCSSGSMLTMKAQEANKIAKD